MVQSNKKQILFLTGTRADYGKLKPLMSAVDSSDLYDCKIFATGMHTLDKYGFTIEEVRAGGFEEVYMYVNQIVGEPMDLILANTIHGLARYVHDNEPDLIVVHGDRVEALAGAIVGSLRNIKVAHIEGGELSGTIDELIRHSVSKLSHTHFVANEEAASRLMQMGEEKKSIYVIGSPDIDVMLSEDLPAIEEVKSRYDIGFDEYGLSLFHTVTTELDDLTQYAKDYVDALIESGKNYVVIYPNNDEGTEMIMTELKRLENHDNFRVLPSMRFEYFLSVLKHTEFVIGNSSAGIREAPVYAVPTVNIGTRQNNRYEYSSIINSSHDKKSILKAIKKAEKLDPQEPSTYFGEGNSFDLFMKTLENKGFWNIKSQKQFKDITEAVGLYQRDVA